MRAFNFTSAEVTGRADHEKHERHEKGQKTERIKAGLAKGQLMPDVLCFFFGQLRKKQYPLTVIFLRCAGQLSEAPT
ncbi:hypothetical protein [Desulfoluna sp.]|uniref:hypothetical protein n=1 Tax=Desulfoluna sp. TaxID=2045199 RepID=UPI0026289229|nr:hypothetical protein [Desulfoluna sp.]